MGCQRRACLRRERDEHVPLEPLCEPDAASGVQREPQPHARANTRHVCRDGVIDVECTKDVKPPAPQAPQSVPRPIDSNEPHNQGVILRRLSAGKSSLAVEIEFVSSDYDWNELGYEFTHNCRNHSRCFSMGYWQQDVTRNR